MTEQEKHEYRSAYNAAINSGGGREAARAAGATAIGRNPTSGTGTRVVGAPASQVGSTGNNEYIRGRRNFDSQRLAYDAYQQNKDNGMSTMQWWEQATARKKTADTAVSDLEKALKELQRGGDSGHTSGRTAGERWSNDDTFNTKYDELQAQLKAALGEQEAARVDLDYAEQYKHMDWYDTLQDNGTSWEDAYTTTTDAYDLVSRQYDDAWNALESAKKGNEYVDILSRNMGDADSIGLSTVSEEELQRLEEQVRLLGGQKEMVGERLAIARQAYATGDDEAIARGQQRYRSLKAMADAEYNKNLGEYIDSHMDAATTAGGVVDILREDQTPFMPTDLWGEGQLNVYYGLLGNGREEEARQYAVDTNTYLNDAAKQGKTQGVYDWGYSKGEAGLGKALAGTAASVASAPEKLVRFIDKAQHVKAQGVYVGNNDMWLSDYADALTGGVTQSLNEQVSFGEKGLGDLYQVGNSMAQSLVYGGGLSKVAGKVIAEGATLATFFGAAANDSFDEALARGATGEQAVTIGVLSGAAEVLAEKIPLENLLDMNKSAARGLARTILKQAGLEGTEEGITEVMNMLADEFVMGDKSGITQRIQQRMQQGESYDSAVNAEWKQFAKDVAWSIAAGAISGGTGMAVGYGLDTVSPYTADEQGRYRYGADAQTLVDEAKQLKDVPRSTVAEAEKKLGKGKNISNRTAKTLTTTVNRGRMVDAVEQQINDRASELDAKTARSLANAVVAKSRNEKLTDRWQKLLKDNSEIADSLAKELDPKNPAKWAQNIGMRGTDAKTYGSRNIVNLVDEIETATLTTGEYADARADLIEQGQDKVKYTEDFDIMAEVYGNTKNYDSFETAWEAAQQQGSTLTEAQARAAWDAGQAKLQSADHTPKINRRGTGAVSFEAVSDGGVVYEAPSDSEVESFKKSARYKYLSELAKRLKVDIVFFKAGAEGINGKYLDGTVYLAVDASPSKYNSVEGYVMMTAAHELTHYIREASPARYAELKDFVIKNLIEKGKMEGKTLKELILAKQNAYANAGVDLSMESVIEEVVADACEMMLKDNMLVAQLREENETLYGSVSKWLKRFMRKVRVAFKGLEAHHTEAKAIEDSFREVQRIWNLGLSEAAGIETATRESKVQPAVESESAVENTEEQRTEDGKVSALYGTAENHIDNRTTSSVASRKMNAFQFDHPELHGYFVEAARELADEVQAAQMQDTVQRYKKGGAKYHGPVAQLVDMGLTKPRVLKCIDDIINDKGAENYADAKRVEIVLNDMLSNGWRDMSRRNHKANAEYIAAKERIAGGRDSGSWEAYLEDHILGVLDGLVTEEELRREWESGRGKYSRKNAVDNFDGKSYPNVELSARERIMLQSEAMTWHADKVGQVIHHVLGETEYVYTFDADYNLNVTDKFRAKNIHERQENVNDKRNRGQTDTVDDRLGRGRQSDTLRVLRSGERRADAGSNRDDGGHLRGERESDRGRDAKDHDSLQVSPRVRKLFDYAERIKGFEILIKSPDATAEEKTKYRREIKKLREEINRRGSLSIKDDAISAWVQTRDIMQQRNELQRRLEDFKTTEEYNTETDKFFQAVLSGENQKAALAEYREWEERSGYAQMTAEIKRLDEEYNRLFDEYTRLSNEAEQEEKNAAIAKSGLNEDAYYQKQAVKEFGYTPYFYDAGYIVPNGKMLNFSGEKGKHYGMRGQDHRAIGTIYPSNISGSEAMLKFMGSGNVRIMAETPGIDIAVGVEPTKEQYSTIGKFVNDSISNRYFSVDFTDSKGITVANLEYEGNFSATKVKSDIKHYFETGEIRKQSTVQRFMYSLKDGAYMSAVDTGDMETAQRMVDEAAERAGYDIKAYHGTPNGTFTVFRDWQYFTENREYADIYQNQGASSNGYKATAQNPKTYSVFLKLNNVFDTRNPEEQRIFYDAFFRKWGNGAPLSERGLPDWTDGDDLIEFFEENGYTYDAVLVDEGGTGGYGDVINDRGISIVVKESSQIKSADPVTYDDAGNVIPLSQRFNERQPDIRYSIKDEAQSDRMLLANTLMTAAQNDGERRRLNNYKAQMDKFEEIQQRLYTADEELSKAIRAGVKADIDKARRERNALTQKLIRADSKLVELQATKPLKDLLSRVKQDTRRNTQRQARERKSKTELRNKIKKLHKDMTTRLLTPNEKRYIPNSLLKSVAEILDLVNLDSGRSEKLKAKLSELSGMYQQIASSNEYAFVFDPVVDDMIKQLHQMLLGMDDTSIYNMTREELTMVYQTMKAINHTVRNAVKLINYETEKNIFEIAKDLMRETGRANPIANKLGNKYLNATLRPDVFFKRLGGYVKNSAWQMLGDMLNEAQRKQTQIQMEGAAIFEELMRDTKAFDRMTDHKNLIDIGLRDERGNEVPVTMDIAIKIYMDTMAEDNARHLMGGGYTIPDMREYYKGSAAAAYGRGSVTIHGFGPLFSELNYQLRHAETDEERADIQAQIDQAEADAIDWVDKLRKNIYDQLGEYELEWIKAAEMFFNDYSQKTLNETTMAVYGFEKATVPYYVPIHTDSAYRQANFESISRDMSLENSGFMKARVEGAKNPMLAEGIVDVINGQIDKVAKYAAMMPAIRNFQKVYGKSTAGFENSVQNAVRSKFGNEALKYIENIITDMTSPRRTEGGLLGDFADRLRGNLAQAALTVNPRVALEQVTSYPKAAVVVGYEPLIKAFRDIKDNPVRDQEAREEIAKWTPLMWYRMQGYFDRDIGDLRNDKQMLNKVNKKLKFITGWIEAVEGATVGQMWYAAQYYVEDTTDLERGTDEFMQETAKVFNRIVEQTQANYTMFQRPDILRNPNAIVKQLTMFMTERLQNANMVIDAVGTYNAYLKDFRNGENDVTEDDMKQAKQTLVRTASSLIAATASSVALKLAVDALMYSMKGYRDEDEELTMASIIGQVVENFFESAAGNFLWGSELFSIMRSVVTDETYYGISLGGVETFTDALNALVKTLQEPTWENWKKSIKTGMQMLGIPLNNGIKIYNAIAYRIKDVQEGNGWGSYASEVNLTEEQRNKQLYNAVVSGNEKRAKDLFEYYGTEADADEALAKHIKSMYEADELTEDEAKQQLEEYAGMSPYDAKLETSKLRCEKETGIAYNDLKQAFLDEEITEEQAVEYRAEYGLYNKSDAAADVRQWACELETGYAYDDLQRHLAAEDITKQQAIDYRMEYGGQDLEDATVTVTKWMGEIETGIPYNKVEDYYRDGLVSHDYLVDYYMKYWSYDEAKAIQVADKRMFVGDDESLESASLAAVTGYYGYCDEAKVDKHTYLEAYQTCYDIRADKDENGKSISGTALKKKLAYIDGLNLQPYQKTAVSKAIGITDKQLKKYKAAWL